MGSEADLAVARSLVKRAQRVLVLTGAGVSADSGVPTFRGPEGLWKRFRPEELATPRAFARDPRLVWEWYAWRRARVAECRPNAAHQALARWALARPGVRIVTQNVDGLHALAAAEASAEAEREQGTAGEQGSAVDEGSAGKSGALPLELHGSLFRVRCTRCPERYEHRDPISTRHIASLPACRACGALLRPDVVWFGEALPSAVLSEALRLAEEADLCLAIGTSAVVQPAASLPGLTRAAGGSVIEVNPKPTPLTDLAAASLRARAAAAVPRLLASE